MSDWGDAFDLIFPEPDLPALTIPAAELLLDTMTASLEHQIVLLMGMGAALAAAKDAVAVPETATMGLAEAILTLNETRRALRNRSIQT